MQQDCPSPERRDFFKKAATVGLGAFSLFAPIGASVAVLFDPLRRKAAAGADAVPVTMLNALPEDGIPRKFPVLASRIDAWNKSPLTPIGAVYLRREKGKPIEAINVVCPHAGCFVDYSPANNNFLCPCHNSAFNLDGAISNPTTSPSPRGLDHLEVELRNETEIWVKFQNYRAGIPQKIPA